VASLPTLKVFQSTTAFWLVWLTLRVLPDWLMLAWPAFTCPPVGSWVAATAGGVVTVATVWANTGAENRPAMPRS